uniref:Uncharacterized protein n=1 Tax=Aegilops tauschii subsp. strangulata TaxID=200361 RepID=A0A453AFH2_AEGTS
MCFILLLLFRLWLCFKLRCRGSSKILSAPFLLLIGVIISMQVNIDEGESFILCLLPLTICLLRTDKVPVVLRIYHDTLITVMKASTKSTVM